MFLEKEENARREESKTGKEIREINSQWCGNSGNLLSHYFQKNFVKAMFIVKIFREINSYLK